MGGALKIVVVASECVPFAKTGGLGDVVGSLPRFLKEAGHNIIVVIPLYSFIDRNKYKVNISIDKINVRMGDEQIDFSVHETKMNGNVPVYFIDYEPFFGRPNIYHDDNFNDYQDNPKRFSFLSKAALQLCIDMNFSPDIVHANDWHTSILPAYLKRIYKNDPVYANTATVLTIHNLAYQGRYDKYFYNYAGLGEEDFTPDKFECFNAVNFLKGGIHFADAVNTVSKGYATETRTPSGGYGLDHFLNLKGDNYSGILNGADYEEWDPGKDKLIPVNYTYFNINGKSECKRVLQEEYGLQQNAKSPVIGIISRLVDQKGFYMLSECIEDILKNMDVQFVILGSGDKQLENFFSDLQQRFTGKAGTFIGYNNRLAHLIESGSDFFLMPSLYEPCGLNQIYSLKYGTLPIVRATGGLNDTVENYNQNIGEGTGFKFWEPRSKAIYNTISWALDTYNNRKPHLQNLIKRAMEQNFSWEKSAAEYVVLYRRAIANKKSKS